MRKPLFLLGLVALTSFLALAATPPGAPPVDELALGAQPKSQPIRHVSPERFENSLLVQVGADGGTLTIDGAKTLVAHTLPDAGTAQLAVETHTVTLSSGTLTYTFKTAFSGIPTCVCSDTASTAAACSTNAATASQVVVKGGTSAVVNVVCVGAR